MFVRLTCCLGVFVFSPVCCLLQLVRFRRRRDALGTDAPHPLTVACHAAWHRRGAMGFFAASAVGAVVTEGVHFLSATLTAPTCYPVVGYDTPAGAGVVRGAFISSAHIDGTTRYRLWGHEHGLCDATGVPELAPTRRRARWRRGGRSFFSAQH